MTLSQFADAKSEKKNFGNKLVLPYFSEYIKDGKSISQSNHNKPFVPKLQLPQKLNEQKPDTQKKIDIHPKIEIQPDWKKGVLIGDKKVKLVEMNVEVAMVIPMEKKNISLKIGDEVWVRIKQLKKDGTINQVEFMSKE